MSSDNPYAPPQAPVALPPESIEPPRRIPPIVAITVLVLATSLLVFGGAYVIQTLPAVATGEVTPPGFLITVTFLAVRGWLLFKTWRGRNWARIALTVFIVLGLIGAVVRLTILMSEPRYREHIVWDWSQYLTVVQPVAQLVAVALLFTAPANPWFRRRRSV